MVMQDNICALGLYPLKGNAATDPPAITRQFAPRDVDTSDPKNPRAICHMCDQWTMVKTVAPRKGYFGWHRSSIKGHVPSNMTTASGTPARVRGRATGKIEGPAR